MTSPPPWDPFRPAGGGSWPAGGPSSGPDGSWWQPGAPPPSPPPPRRRRRRGGGVVVLLVALLAAAVWWERTPDPVGALRALADPATYADLVEQAGDVVDDVASGRPLGDGSRHDTGTIPGIGGLAADGAPPPGQGEAGSRLLPAVAVPTASTSYGFAALQDDGTTPVTWSPCRSIHYVVRTDGAPDGFADAVSGALADISAATGLSFTEDGGTSEAPSAARGAYLPDLYGDRWAPVLVAVTDSATVPVLDGEVAGIAYTYRVQGRDTGTWHLTSGAVYIDAETLDVPASGGEPGWVPVLRHELGHVVGLDHVDDPSQLMNPVTSGLRTYQDGDRAGLALLGQGPCAPDV